MNAYMVTVRTDLEVLGVGAIPAGSTVQVTTLPDPLSRSAWQLLEFEGGVSCLMRPGRMQLLLAGVDA